MRPAKKSPWQKCRRGKALVLVLVCLTAILAVVGLVFDGGLLTADSQNLKHAVDAAATAGAMDLLLDKSAASAEATAAAYVRDLNGLADAALTVNCPPLTGSYAGRSDYLEVIATRGYQTRLMQAIGADPQQTIAARSVAGYEASTAGAAIVVLDEDPPPLSIPDMAGAGLASPAYPALLGGLEVLGPGTVRVDGAVLVNTGWGGMDEEGNPAGEAAGPPYGISCTPLLALSRLDARDIYVTGGVDDRRNYGAYSTGGENPLQANRRPVPDPFEDLPVPSVAVDPANVSAALRGGVTVAALPLVAPPTVLQPGVYEWIEVLSGTVVFQPGVYVIRGASPTTGHALNIAGGSVTANGVMFYVTNSTDYDAATGAPDSGDGETRPAPYAPEQTPSVVINAALGSTFSPLNDPASPFDGLLIYQRRRDPRPVVVSHQGLLSGGAVGGTIYAKWGHTLFTGVGTYNLRIVSGTARLVAVTNMTLAPTHLLPPAQDVYLVE